jgi:hypothetical protein
MFVLARFLERALASVSYLLFREKYSVSRMNEVWYYKGLHKVKVVTESEGYWIVEALEEFEDDVDGEKGDG